MAKLLETLRVVNGEIPLFNYHLLRLQSGLMLQAAQPLAPEALAKAITDKVTNGVVRLIVTPMIANPATYDIEVKQDSVEQAIYDFGWSLLQYNQPIPEDQQHHGTKMHDRAFYDQAYQAAKDSGFDEVILCDINTNVVEGSITNIFIVKKQMIITPAIGQYGVNGAMRRYIIDYMQNKAPVELRDCISVEDLYNAEEVFVSNGC